MSKDPLELTEKSKVPVLDQTDDMLEEQQSKIKSDQENSNYEDDDGMAKMRNLVETLDQIELESLPDVDDADPSFTQVEEDIEIVYQEQQTENSLVRNSLECLSSIDQFEVISDHSEPHSEKQKVVETIQVPVLPKPRERKSKCVDSFSVETNSSKNVSLPQNDLVSKTKPAQVKDGVYPVDLNPFGSDDDQDDLTNPSNSIVQIEYPDELNPFDDDDDLNKTSNNRSSNSLNPFGSESEDDDCSQTQPVQSLSIKFLPSKSSDSKPVTPVKKKKRPAPLPPNKSDQSLDQLVVQDSSAMYDSFISNTSSNPDLDGSIGGYRSRTPTPTPRRSRMNQSSSSSNLLEQESISSNASNSGNSVQAQLKAIKSKKRPAPPIPAFKRSLKTSSEDINKELEQIGDQLPTIETERVELEQWLLDHKSNESEIDVEQQKLYEEKMQRFLDLAKQKCKLGRKQKELMYMKREVKLEETQLELEYELRVIMSKQDAQKTDQDRNEEQRLLNRMMEIIDERNDIIENMIQDENKEIEQYQSMISRVVPQTSSQLEQQTSSNTSNHLKPFSKLKKLNKKFKTKIKKQPVADNASYHSDASSISEENSSIKEEAIATDQAAKSKTKRKDLATLGRSTLKKLKHPGKTLHSVSTDLKSKLHSSTNSNNN